MRRSNKVAIPSLGCQNHVAITERYLDTTISHSNTFRILIEPKKVGFFVRLGLAVIDNPSRFDHVVALRETDPKSRPRSGGRTGEAWWHKVKSLTRSLVMLWVAIGVTGAAYAIFAICHPGYGEGLLIPPTFQWPGEPQLITDAAPVAEVTWGLLTIAVLMVGISHLRRQHPKKWVRVCGWTAGWFTGCALMFLAAESLTVGMGEVRINGALILRETIILITWLFLGGAMTAVSASSERR